MRNQVFISYSHKDKRWLDQLQVFLKPMDRSGIINKWDDTNLKAGQKWRDEIQKALASAKVAVLLVSANFLASDFISDDELPPLLSAAAEGGAVVLPVLISPCDLPESLSQFQAVNDPQKTLVDMKKGERDRVWVKVAKAIESAFAETTESAKASATEVPEDQKQKAGAAVTPTRRGSPPKNEAASAPTISVAEELELDGARVGDIAAAKGRDPAAAIPPGAKVDVARRAKIKDSETGDIVGFIQQGNREKDK
jgi:hypothetical protein